MVLSLIILSTFLISLIALVGMLTLYLKEKVLDKVLIILVAFSAGTLLGGAFIHLIPEAVEHNTNSNLFLYVLAGFVFFLITERYLFWRHCHKSKCPKHTFGLMNLIGDGIHNFIDGLVIAPAFIVSTALGFTTTLAIALHEIPQEIGDFGVLVYSGINKRKALLLNFLAALTVIIGGLVGYFVSNSIQAAIPILLPFAAGGFIYIASMDLIPEIKKHKHSNQVIVILIAGMLLMWLTRLL